MQFAMCPFLCLVGTLVGAPSAAPAPPDRTRRSGRSAHAAERRVVGDHDGVAADVDVLVLEVRQRQLGELRRRRRLRDVVDLQVADLKTPLSSKARRRGRMDLSTPTHLQTCVHRAERVVDVRLAVPDGRRRPVVQRRARATTSRRHAIDEARSASSHHARSKSRLAQHRGRSDRLAQHPVQARAHDRLPVEVDRVDEPAAVPAVVDRAARTAAAPRPRSEPRTPAAPTRTRARASRRRAGTGRAARRGCSAAAGARSSRSARPPRTRRRSARSSAAPARAHGFRPVASIASTPCMFALAPR